jgi:hypothetical protein
VRRIIEDQKNAEKKNARRYLKFGRKTGIEIETLKLQDTAISCICNVSHSNINDNSE